MAGEAEIAAKFWKALKSDMTLMLGLSGVEQDHCQPMTAQLDGDGVHGPIWFFTAKDTDLVRQMGRGHRAVAHFASKSHQVVASLHGQLVPDDDRATIDRLWNRFVAAWFEGGKSDPKLQLIRFEPREGRIWLNENQLFTATKLLLGRDPKEDFKDKVATVNLS